jgi:hypothetical protein
MTLHDVTGGSRELYRSHEPRVMRTHDSSCVDDIINFAHAAVSWEEEKSDNLVEQTCNPRSSLHRYAAVRSVWTSCTSPCQRAVDTTSARRAM